MLPPWTWANGPWTAACDYKQPGGYHGVRIGEKVAVLRVKRPIRPEMGRPVQNHSNTDRCSCLNSAIRINNCTDPCIGGPHHVPPIFDGSNNAHPQMLKGR